MTDTYTGWDGKDYPWPPPEGWYEASDGRWWAPGTGPNPPPETPAPPSRPQTFAPGDLGGYDDGSDEPGTMQLAQTPSRRPSYDDEPQTAPVGGSHTPPSGVNYGATSSFAAGEFPAPGGPSGSRSPSMEGGMPPPGVGDLSHEPEGGGGGRRFLFLGLGVLVALVVLGGAYVLLSGNDEETASTGTTAPEDATATSAVTPDGSTSDSSTPDGAADGSTSTTDPDAAGATSTTGADGSSTTLATDPSQIDQFRSLLQENGLTSDKLTDADVLGFGTSFCTLASTSSSPEVFNEFRQDAIESTANSTLGPEELGLVIDSAIVSFCPDEAERLSIGGG